MHIAAAEVENGHGKAAAIAHSEGDLLAVRRPVRLRVVAVAGAEESAAAAARGNAVELRAATVVAGVDDLVTARSPRRRTLHAGCAGETMGSAAARTGGVKLGIAVLAQD